MRRHLAATAALLALAACKVEPTPREFYTQRDPGRVEQQDAAGEIRVRVRNFAEALARGDRAEAVEALAPQPLAVVSGVDGNGGITRRGPQGLAQALDSVHLPAPATARAPDLEVQVGFREGMGWFSTHLEVIPLAAPTSQTVRMRASGVFARDRGAWRLQQLHLSLPSVPPPPADSAAADTASTDPARAGAAATDPAP